MQERLALTAVGNDRIRGPGILDVGGKAGSPLADDAGGAYRLYELIPVHAPVISFARRPE
jgi:hypothetical protein